jgi:hypothetical protein
VVPIETFGGSAAFAPTHRKRSSRGVASIPEEKFEAAES